MASGLGVPIGLKRMGKAGLIRRLLLREALFFFGLSVTIIPLFDLILAFARPEGRGLSDLLLGTQIMKVSAVQSAP